MHAHTQHTILTCGPHLSLLSFLFQAGTCFGELALMYNAPRAASVIAATDATVWVVDRFTFRRIVTNLTRQKFDNYCTFLKQVRFNHTLASVNHYFPCLAFLPKYSLCVSSFVPYLT
jgi:hypothetical protein